MPTCRSPPSLRSVQSPTEPRATPPNLAEPRRTSPNPGRPSQNPTDPQEDEELVATVGPGEHVGELTLLGPEVFGLEPDAQGNDPLLRSATVRAATHCELFLVGAADFASICSSYPDVRAELIKLGKRHAPNPSHHPAPCCTAPRTPHRYDRVATSHPIACA